MNNNLINFIDLLKKQNLIATLKHYQQCSEQENLQQLNFLFQQSQSFPTTFQQLQELATRCIATKAWPKTFNQHIKSAELLSFFTPALQLEQNFTQTDDNERNVLHYLLLTNSNCQPPFVYLRSMMLFESNQALVNALSQRDKHQFTPFEIYLGANRLLTNLKPHEYTAALALIEIQHKSTQQLVNNLQPVIKSVYKMCKQQSIPVNEHLHRLQLIATYFSTSVSKLIAHN